MAVCTCELGNRRWDPFRGICLTCKAWHADRVSQNLKSQPKTVVSTSPFEAQRAFLTREEPCTPKRHKLKDCPFCGDSGLVTLSMSLSDVERLDLIEQLTRAGDSWK